MKKILYLKGSGVGDIISSIPKLFFLKKDGYKIIWLFFDNFDKSYLNLLEILKKNSLIDEIIFVKNKKIFLFLLKNFFRYEEVFIGGIFTLKNFIFARFIGKKIFGGIKKLNGGKSIIEFENNKKQRESLLLNNFNFLKFSEKTIKGEKYVVFYPSAYKRSLDERFLIKILDLLSKTGLKIIFIGGNREKWFNDILSKYKTKKFINYIGKIFDFEELFNILHFSEFNILHNGGIMWMANLVNKNNLNIHVNSYKIWHPVSDGKGIINIFSNYEKIGCVPCEGKCKIKNKFACKKEIYFKEIERYILKLK